ncbi:MAG: T9SS type A sorting domain-containing protein [Saprospiraceae bacterium]
MKSYLLLLKFTIFYSYLYSQTFNLTVENGYGDGLYKAGDTVHIWSQEWSAASTFSHWSGDTTFLFMPDEWRTQVIMPARNITVKANIQVLPTGTANYFNFNQIRGKNIIKPVYYYFPANGNTEAVVWLWHGTGGNAQNWIWKNFQMRQFCNYLVANNFAIIVTESDESTLNRDMTGDGYIRYDYSADTINNADVANVRAIRDTFINRGFMSRATPQVAVGFSAGGAFSVTIATFLNWKAAITHNNQGSGYARITSVPVAFSMTQRDAHPDVGMEGNQEAFENYQFFLNKNQCTAFYLVRPSPIYPQRFKRIPGISEVKSNAIYNELVANNCVAPNNYLTKAPAEIEQLVIANPQKWVNVVTLSDTLRDFVLNEIEVTWSSHAFSHDFMAKDVKFIKSLCNNTTVNVNNSLESEPLTIFPNPANDKIYLSKPAETVRILDLQGKIILQKQLNGATEVEVSHVTSGLYILELINKGQRHVVKWVKLE